MTAVPTAAVNGPRSLTDRTCCTADVQRAWPGDRNGSKAAVRVSWPPYLGNRFPPSTPSSVFHPKATAQSLSFYRSLSSNCSPARPDFACRIPCDPSSPRPKSARPMSTRIDSTRSEIGRQRRASTSESDAFLSATLVMQSLLARAFQNCVSTTAQATACTSFNGQVC